MPDRKWLILAVLALPLTGVHAAGFPEQDQAFRAAVADPTATEAARAEAVNAMSELGTGASVESLLWGVGAIDEKLDPDYDERGRLSREYQPYNSFKLTNAERKTKAKLEARIAVVEGRIMDHEAVLLILMRELSSQSATEALDVLGGSRALRASNWRAKAYAGAAAAGIRAIPAAGPLRLLKDSDPRVRSFVAEGFGRRKDPAVIPDLGKVLTGDKAWQVRAAVVEALESIGSIKAARFLIEALGKESGRLLEDLNAVLKKLTGQNFQPDYPAWKRWYDENREKIEGGEQVKGPRKNPRWRKKDGANVYGLKTFSKRVMFLLDVSGSMKDPLGRPGAVTGGDEEDDWHGPKIDMAKKELKRVIRQFTPDAFFNIIAFNQLVTPWKPKMLKASQKNKNEAYVWIRKLEAETSTYLYGALKAAFEMAGMGATDPNYQPALDTILLLSDGAPTDNTMAAKRMDTEFILEAVRSWNKLSKITIHVIAIDEAAHGQKSIQFLRKLAKENNGTYVAK